MDQQKLHELRVFAAEIRLETLKIIGSRGFGHVGGSMSMADAMAVLYGADAVYLAGTSFGMRSFAGNFSPEELPCTARS